VLDSAYGVTGDNVHKVTKGFDLSKPADIAKFGSYLGAQGGIQAVAQTAIQGGSLSENLQHSLTNQVQHLLQAVAFNSVGDFAQGRWEDGSPQKAALHALVGGMLSEAAGGDFRTGALAAGANELLVEQLAGAIKSDPQLELAVSQLIGVAAATATGGDPALAAELAKNATAYNRQLHPDEIKFASDADRVRRYAEETGLSEDAARQELLRTAAGMVDKGWNEALGSQDGNTERALSFLRAELSAAQSDLFRVTLTEYNDERLGLKELFRDREALTALVRDVALVDPLAYKTDPRYFQEVLNARGLGSQEGFGNAVESAIAGPSKAAMWLMGVANCPSCAIEDIQNAWEAVSELPEELSYKAYLDNLHIMQGHGAAVIQQNAASSTELGVGIGLAGSASPGKVGVGGVPKAGETKFGPHEIGPLGNPNDSRSVASTFRSGSYVEKVAETDVYFYRDYGGKAAVDGRYWTPEPSSGPLQSQLDSAILPEWGNTFESRAVIKVPKGTTYYEGPAAPQTGKVDTFTTLHGGGTQIFLPKPKMEWIIDR
jgi:filamentous hemagglutinin